MIKESYLANDCIKCGREFNALVHKAQVCIVCLENKYNSAVCGDHLVPVSACGCLR